MMTPNAKVLFTYQITWADDTVETLTQIEYGGFHASERCQDLGIMISTSTILRSTKERVYEIGSSNKRALACVPRRGKDIKRLVIKIQRQ